MNVIVGECPQHCHHWQPMEVEFWSNATTKVTFMHPHNFEILPVEVDEAYSLPSAPLVLNQHCEPTLA